MKSNISDANIEIEHPQQTNTKLLISSDELIKNEKQLYALKNEYEINSI